MKRLPFILATLLCSASAWAVEIDDDARDRIGIQIATLEKATLTPEVTATATVLSPAPLIDLFRQSEASRAAAKLSKESLARAESLFATGELVARKDVEAARGALIQDEAKIQALEDRIALEWGPAFAAMSGEDRAKDIREMLAGHRVLVRLAITHQDWLDELPKAARLSLAGRDLPIVRGTRILPSTTTDPAFQSQAFLGVFDSEKPLPAPGAQLKAVLEMPGETTEGWQVPASAVVFSEGHAWIYRHEHAGEFIRVEIPSSHPMKEGWFVEKSTLEPEGIVITGAQSLLSKESLGSEATAGE